jgi:hypothetical protein
MHNAIQEFEGRACCHLKLIAGGDIGNRAAPIARLDAGVDHRALTMVYGGIHR